MQISPAIFATDIDQLALRAARAGVYKLKSVLNVKQAHLHKYFNTEVDRFELTPAIKDMVDFSTFDMLNDITAVPEESIFGGFDVVLCRNLLIYFEADFQEKIMEKLYHSLNKNGLLILGESERPVGAYRDRFKEITTLCRIYRKLR